MIVVDLGCQTYGDEESIQKLTARFKPALLFGFDPHPETADEVRQIGATTVVTARKAASVVDGSALYFVDGSRTRLASRTGLESTGTSAAQTFDLSAWLFALPRIPTVLKLDVEGAEHELLPHLAHRMADRLLDLILVEWHGDPLDVDLACPVERWP
jgi:FkbM family methyltransferase